MSDLNISDYFEKLSDSDPKLIFKKEVLKNTGLSEVVFYRRVKDGFKSLEKPAVMKAANNLHKEVLKSLSDARNILEQ